MLPTSRIFRSRWAALLWAGGILWTAWDVAESTRHDTAANTADPANTADALGTDAMGDPVTNADLRALANAMGG